MFAFRTVFQSTVYLSFFAQAQQNESFTIGFGIYSERSVQVYMCRIFKHLRNSDRGDVVHPVRHSQSNCQWGRFKRIGTYYDSREGCEFESRHLQQIQSFPLL